MITIREILGDEYSDFIEFCAVSEKIYPSDISSSDYVAFRTQYGVDREYVSEIKDRINGGKVSMAYTVTFAAPKNSEVVEQGECVQKVVANNQLNEASNQKESEVDCPQKDCSKQVNLVVKTDIAEKWNDKKIGDEIIPYDIHTPLYIIFEVDNLEKYAEINIEAMECKSKVELILKGDGRKSVLDVLQCSIVQLFDLNSIARTAIVDIIKQIQRFLSLDVDSILMKLRQVTTPLYVLFDVANIEDYKYISVSSITFSARFANALKENRVDTLFLLLQLKIEDLQNWRHLGSTSIKDAIIRLDEYFNNQNKKIVVAREKVINAKQIRNKVISVIDSEINGVVISCSDLNEDELALYSKLKEAIDVCGEEFYVGVRNNLDYAKSLAKMLNDFYAPILDVLEKKNKLFRSYCEMPLGYRNKSVNVLYKVYKLKMHQEIAFIDDIDKEITLSEFFVGVKESEIVENYRQLMLFLQWVNKMDVNRIADEIFSKDKSFGSYKKAASLKDKYWIVLEMRASGETLENIGSLTGDTRERIRQIEKKYTSQLALNYRNSEYDLLAVIHALRGGDNILNKNEVQSFIGEKATNLLWLVLSKGVLNCDLYRYSKVYDVVIFIDDNKNTDASIKCVLRELPETFFDEERDKLVDGLAQKYDVSRELILDDIEMSYKKYGTLYSHSSPTVAFMCQYVLKMKFPNGFKVGDADESKRFQTYLIEIFGDKKGGTTARALDMKISEIGVLCDRGMYLHPDYVHIEKWIIDEINAYIETDKKQVITYAEIFDELSTTLSGSSITNRFMLQGALKLYGCKYKLAKDYVTKVDGKSLTDEFEDFAREYGEFHKTDFFVAFPSMQDANLAMLIGRCPNVFSIDDGYYVHSSVLNLNKKDYDDIRVYLDCVCANGSTNSRYLFDEFSYRFVDFMSRNEISNHTKLFGILNYMFGKEFVFSRPYISKGENVSLTNRSAVLQCLEGLDTITIENVVAMCQERAIRYMSKAYLIRQLSPDFIRINMTTLMRYEQTGLNDDIILEVASYIANSIKTNKYCSVATIKDFLWFPTIHIEWTPYLVESIVHLLGDMLHRINIPTTNVDNLTSIYVDEEFAEDSYTIFILKILDDAFEKGFFTSKVELRDFLYEKGLIANNGLPSFLEGAEYYYTTDEGILKRRK